MFLYSLTVPNTPLNKNWKPPRLDFFSYFKKHIVFCPFIRILRALPGEFKDLPATAPQELINKLSFTHFVELIQCKTPLQRIFYETESIKNNWSTGELQRAKNSLLYERTGVSKDKKVVLESINKQRDLKPENIYRNPYMLEFLGLEEKSSYSETALEEAIINLPGENGLKNIIEEEKSKRV